MGWTSWITTAIIATMILGGSYSCIKSDELYYKQCIEAFGGTYEGITQGSNISDEWEDGYVTFDLHRDNQIVCCHHYKEFDEREGFVPKKTCKLMHR